MQANPENLEFVKKKLLDFVNVHLGMNNYIIIIITNEIKTGKLGKTITQLDKDFNSGVNLLLLIGQLEGYFIPLYEYHYQPTRPEECLANVTLAFDYLMNMGGIQLRNPPQEVVRGDLKAIMRILYGLLVKFK